MADLTSLHKSAFDDALDEFKKTLSKRDEETFKGTTLDSLEKSITDIEQKHNNSRRQKAMARLKPFLTASQELGQVIDLFCNCNDFVPFIWGPMKLLLTVTCSVEKAFNGLLEIYRRIGENLPLLLEYERLLRDNPHLMRALSLMYRDILRFHRDALHYFQQPLWKQFFTVTWKSYESQFASIIADMAAHRSLIESHATLAQIEQAWAERAQREEQTRNEINNENMRRLQVVSSWLKATDVETDQYELTRLREKYPDTGRWLLSNTTFTDWFHPVFAKIPPLLWLSGKPGSGKTVLASLVVEEARKLKQKPTVLYFYFKYQNPERDNFLQLARSLLAQFLRQDTGLLLYMYERCCSSGEAFLTTPGLAKELLDLAFDNCKSAYIILDGVDECSTKEQKSREERKKITEWFRNLINKLPKEEPARFRCLFISQDDGIARKDFFGMSHLEIKVEDNQHDIDKYCHIEARTLLQHFELSENELNKIAERVAGSVDGLFLLARLIWSNLAEQTSLDALREELEPVNFPETINDAYQKILTRIEQASRKPREEAMMVLEWLLCAKRQLKWREIQVMKAIRRNERDVDLEGLGFRVKAKDLCHSLIEERSNGAIEFIHRTVKRFLVHREYGKLDPVVADLRMTLLCVDYLNLPAFTNPPNKDKILDGDYGFMDYAVLNWVWHLEAGLSQAEEDSMQTIKETERESTLEELQESLGVFLGHHWNNPTAQIRVLQKTQKRLESFRSFAYYENLVQAVASTKEQLKFFGKMKEEQAALNLEQVVRDVRDELEAVFTHHQNLRSEAFQEDFKQKYGADIFKCHRFSCDFFTSGFTSIEKREDHLNKHDRPFRCTDEDCIAGFKIGFPSQQDLNRHNRERHSQDNVEDNEFPSEFEVQQSLQKLSITEQKPQQEATVESVQEEVMEEQNAEVSETSEKEEQPKSRPQLPRKRIKQTEFKCNQCEKVFRKKFNLQSHQQTHSTEKNFICQHCNKGFARKNDLRRHEDSIHRRDVNAYVCMGCGNSFARADNLNKHYESITGSACRESERQKDAIQLF